MKPISRFFLTMATFSMTAAGHAGDRSRVDPFMVVFASTCMKNFYAQDELKREMEKSPELPDDLKKFFLSGNSGHAWPILHKGKKYALSLRDDGICAVFADKGDPELIEENFREAVSKAPEPLVAIIPKGDIGPNTGKLKSLAWDWSRPSDKVALHFTLTTSRDPDTQVAAMASMSVTNKSN